MTDRSYWYTIAGLVLLAGVAVVAWTQIAAQSSVTTTSSVELGLAELGTNSPERGYALPASGDSPPPPPPSPSIESFEARIEGDDTWYRVVSSGGGLLPQSILQDLLDALVIAPGHEMSLRWDTNGYNECTGDNFDTGPDNPSQGEVTIDEVVFPPETERDYTLTCSGTQSGYEGGSSSATITIRIPGADLAIETASRLIRSGETAEVSWDVALQESLTATPDNDLTPYPSLSCNLYGAVAENDINLPTGSAVSGPISNFFVNTLKCVESYSGYLVTDTSTLEVIPAPIER